MISLRNVLIGLLLLAAIILSAWSIFLSTHPTFPSKKNSNEPDAFMENVVAVIMNKQGMPALKVFTPQMVHYFQNDATTITKPHVIVYRDSPEPWHINSDYAVAYKGTTQINFQNHVVINHLADVSNPKTVLQTSSITVFPDQQLATTRQPVVIEQPDTIVHGVGLLANLNDGTVKLLSAAEGQYAPPKS